MRVASSEPPAATTGHSSAGNPMSRSAAHAIVGSFGDAFAK
jgi:hypothetical protein